MKLLAKNPEERYASAAELADVLERLRSGLLLATAAPEKTTAPLPPNPEARTRETAFQPPVAPRKVIEHGGGHRRRLLPVLGALLFGLVKSSCREGGSPDHLKKEFLYYT